MRVGSGMGSWLYPARMSFTKWTSPKVDFVKEDTAAWSTIILVKSDGFTRAGIKWLNDSIMIYVT